MKNAQEIINEVEIESHKKFDWKKFMKRFKKENSLSFQNRGTKRLREK